MVIFIWIISRFFLIKVIEKIEVVKMVVIWVRYKLNKYIKNEEEVREYVYKVIINILNVYVIIKVKKFENIIV